MAEIKFYANINVDNSNKLIAHELGSGIGFYGADYGVSVPIGSTQDSTWITNSTGTEATHQLKLHNTKFVDKGTTSTEGTVLVNTSIGTATNLDKLPNYLAPLNIRFTHTEAVRVQNCKLRIFDRSNIATHAVGVTTYVYEARHPADSPSVTHLDHRGITDGDYWTEFASDVTMADMIFTDSPGISGHSSSVADTDHTGTKWNSSDDAPSPLQGNLHESTQHDWYTAISAEPETIGSKTDFGLYFTLEYL